MSDKKSNFKKGGKPFRNTNKTTTCRISRDRRRRKHWKTTTSMWGQANKHRTMKSRPTTSSTTSSWRSNLSQSTDDFTSRKSGLWETLSIHLWWICPSPWRTECEEYECTKVFRLHLPTSDRKQTRRSWITASSDEQDHHPSPMHQNPHSSIRHTASAFNGTGRRNATWIKNF